MSTGALSGIRVIDLTQVMAGPFCTMLLADLGADVVKVEPPGGGDTTRHSWGRGPGGGDGPAFFALNRNKRSVCLDLTTPPGRADFRKLLASADVVVESFRPGVAAKLGVDYPSVREVRPQVVYASLSGFGQDGPYAQRPGYDLIAQAMGGLMSVTGEPDGPPVKCGLPVSDLGAGMLCAFGIQAALFHRERTGEGQYLETSLFDAAVAMSVWESTEYWSTGQVPRPLGSAHRMSAPYQALRTADGYLTVGANNQRLWTRLCEAIGRPDLVDDPRFATNPDRMRHLAELAAELETALAGRTTAQWVEVLLAAGVPAGPVQRYDQVLSDPHTLARGLVRTVDHPVAGPVKVLGPPVKFSATPAEIRRPPPLLDQHREELLGGPEADPDGGGS